MGPWVAHGRPGDPPDVVHPLFGPRDGPPGGVLADVFIDGRVGVGRGSIPSGHLSSVVRRPHNLLRIDPGTGPGKGEAVFRKARRGDEMGLLA